MLMTLKVEVAVLEVLFRIEPATELSGHDWDRNENASHVFPLRADFHCSGFPTGLQCAMNEFIGSSFYYWDSDDEIDNNCYYLWIDSS